MIIGISGKMGSGKTTLSNAIKELYPQSKSLKFADPLYEMHNALIEKGRQLGIPFPNKVGELLQFLGTEVCRKRFGEDVWVNTLIGRIGDFPGIVIVDDVRFKNEADGLRRRFGDRLLLVRLECDREVRKSRCDGWRDNENHPSETDLDDYDKWDLVFNTENPNTSQYLSEIKKIIG